MAPRLGSLWGERQGVKELSGPGWSHRPSNKGSDGVLCRVRGRTVTTAAALGGAPSVRWWNVGRRRDGLVNSVPFAGSA